MTKALALALSVALLAGHARATPSQAYCGGAFKEAGNQANCKSDYGCGTNCTKGKQDYDLCSSNKCERTTACPTVPGGYCTQCHCPAPNAWGFRKVAATTSNLATAYTRATKKAGSVATLVQSCPATVLFSKQSAVSASCAATLKVTAEIDGALTMKYSGSVQSVSSPDCGTANSCVAGVKTSIVVAAAKDSVAEFTYRAIRGSDWYEVVVALYKASNKAKPNLDSDTLIGVKAVRGDQITSSQCPTSKKHKVCGKSAEESYSCDSKGYITDVLTIPAAGDYYLAFYPGSYDRSGGTVLGATLTVKGFRLLPKTCKPVCNINATYSGATCTKVQCASSLVADADGDATNGCEKKLTAAPTTVPPTKKPTAQPTPGPTAVGNPCAYGTIGDCTPHPDTGLATSGGAGPILALGATLAAVSATVLLR